MNHSIIQKVEDQLTKYKAEHKGEKPLYLIVSPDDANVLFEEVRRSGGHAVDVLVTTYKDIKIVKHDSLNTGELRLTNELIETGS